MRVVRVMDTRPQSSEVRNVGHVFNVPVNSDKRIRVPRRWRETAGFNGLVENVPHDFACMRTGIICQFLVVRSSGGTFRNTSAGPGRGRAAQWLAWSCVVVIRLTLGSITQRAVRRRWLGRGSSWVPSNVASSLRGSRGLDRGYA